MRESKIESAVCKYASDKGWLTFKFTSPGGKGVPDRIFMNRGLVFFVEFKAPGKKPSPLQENVLNKIRSCKIPVYVIDSIQQGLVTIDHMSLDAEEK
jgi:hypothetical protein